VFEQVAKQNPVKIFISIDLAKPNNPIAYKKNKQMRDLALDYASKMPNIQLMMFDQNQGCRKAVSKSITNCFKSVDQLIILEDDCLPLPGFFEYCCWALNEFESNEVIGSVSAQSFLFKKHCPAHDVFFSKYHHCWGWATWKRAWAKYEDDLDKIEPFITDDGLERLASGDVGFVRYWKMIFVGLRFCKYDSWAYRWLFSCWKNNMVSVIPRYSLVRNIGFDSDSTHTLSEPAGIDLNYNEGWSIDWMKISTTVNRDYRAERTVSMYHYRCWVYTIRGIETLVGVWVFSKKIWIKYGKF